MFTGELVKLREYRKEDVEKAKDYLNDPEVRQFLEPGIPYLYTLPNEEKWFESLSAKSDTYSFAIEEKATGEYIGGCGINMVDWKNSKAEVGIFIGKKECWSKGYGSDALKILVKFMFEQMNLNKVKLGVYDFNPRARRCYEKVGFKQEGILRDEIFRNGKYNDVIEMGILRKDYEEAKESELIK